MPDFKNNMEIIQLIIGIIIVVSVKYTIIKIIYNNIRISKLSGDDLKFDEIKSVYNDLKKEIIPKEKEINKLAKNVEKRTLVYEALYQFNKIELFPKEYSTTEKLSESYLANWLNMNEEFDSFPDKIEYKGKVELENGKSIEFFKFGTYEPHMFAERGLMNGYIGYKELKYNTFF